MPHILYLPLLPARLPLWPWLLQLPPCSLPFLENTSLLAISWPLTAHSHMRTLALNFLLSRTLFPSDSHGSPLFSFRFFWDAISHLLKEVFVHHLILNCATTMPLKSLPPSLLYLVQSIYHHLLAHRIYLLIFHFSYYLPSSLECKPHKGRILILFSNILPIPKVVSCSLILNTFCLMTNKHRAL